MMGICIIVDIGVETIISELPNVNIERTLELNDMQEYVNIDGLGFEIGYNSNIDKNGFINIPSIIYTIHNNILHEYRADKIEYSIFENDKMLEKCSLMKIMYNMNDESGLSLWEIRNMMKEMQK